MNKKRPQGRPCGRFRLAEDPCGRLLAARRSQQRVELIRYNKLRKKEKA